MNKIDLQAKLEKDLKKIWSNYKSIDSTAKYCEVSPSFIDFANKNSDVLFIGINPSLREIDKGTENAPLWDKNQSVWTYELNHIQKSNDSYFRSYKKIAKAAELEAENWSYIDLLFVRCTKQKDIHNLCYENSETSQFILEQLKITQRIIDEINPKIIVVANRLAETLLGRHKKPDGSNEWMGLDFQKTEGMDVETWNNKLVVFTGFLSRKSNDFFIKTGFELAKLLAKNTYEGE